MNLDHIIITVPDLEIAVADIERKLGCIPKYGGKHSNLGTRNAILGINNDRGFKQYIELLAKGPDSACPSKELPFDLGTNKTTAKVVGWAIRCVNILNTVARIQQLGLMFECNDIHKVTRQQPDGSTISCTVAYNLAQITDNGGVTPFLIEWGNKEHAVDTCNDENYCDKCCFELRHPLGCKITKQLRALGLNDIVVGDSNKPALSVNLFKNNHNYAVN